MNHTEAIVTAVNAKNAAQVEALLKEDPSLADVRTSSGSLLMTALYSGARDVVQALLAHNPTLDICEAAAVGKADRIAALLEREPGLVHTENQIGFTPLHLAAFYGQADAARVLLDGGAEVNKMMQPKVSFVPSNTALHAAIAGGPHRNVVELLVEAGADVNMINSEGATPLHEAAFHTDIELLAYLLAHGADVSRSGDGVPAPLEYARQRGKQEAAAFLANAVGQVTGNS